MIPPANILVGFLGRAILSVLLFALFPLLTPTLHHCENPEYLSLTSKCFLRVISPPVDKHWQRQNTLPILLGRKLTLVFPFCSILQPAQMAFQQRGLSYQLSIIQQTSFVSCIPAFPGLLNLFSFFSSTFFLFQYLFFIVVSSSTTLTHGMSIMRAETDIQNGA